MSAPSVAAPVALNIKYATLPLFSALTGYSVKACQNKIERGIWLEGKHYMRAPDGRIHMNLPEYELWVEQKGM